jgi:hypothetical protein
MILIGQFILACINVVTGRYHASLIKKMEEDTLAGFQYKKIKHGWWGIAYSGLAALLCYIISQRNGQTFNAWIFISFFANRRLFFDLSVNVYRFGWKGIWYVSPELKNVTGIWDALRKGKAIDWLHFKIFGKRLWLSALIYAAAIVVIIIIIKP